MIGMIGDFTVFKTNLRANWLSMYPNEHVKAVL